MLLVELGEEIIDVGSSPLCVDLESLDEALYELRSRGACREGLPERCASVIGSKIPLALEVKCDDLAPDLPPLDRIGPQPKVVFAHGGSLRHLCSCQYCVSEPSRRALLSARSKR